MGNPEQVSSAQKYFHTLGTELGKVKQESKQPTGEEQPRIAFSSLLETAKQSQAYQESLSVMKEYAHEKKVVNPEHLPVLMSNIRNSADALIAVTIIEESKKKGNDQQVSYGQIRKSLCLHMNVSENEANDVLGKYTTLQEYCNYLVGDIFKSKKVNGSVYYFINRQWQPQVEAFSNILLSGAHKGPLDISLLLESKSQNERGLPFMVELSQFFATQFIRNNKPDTEKSLSHTDIKKQFPAFIPFANGEWNILKFLHQKNILTYDTENRIEWQLPEAAPNNLSIKSDLYTRFYITLQQLQKQENRHYSIQEVAHSMSGDNEDVQEIIFFLKRNISQFETQLKIKGVGLHKRIVPPHITITEQNNYQALIELQEILINGEGTTPADFLTTYRSKTSPESVKAIWLNARREKKEKPPKKKKEHPFLSKRLEQNIQEDPITGEYHKLPFSKWLTNLQFQSELVSELREIDISQRIRFQTWLRLSIHEETGNISWKQFHDSLRHEKTNINPRPSTIGSLLETKALPKDLMDLLREKFPAIFEEDFPLRIGRIEESLKAINPLSTEPLIFNHLQIYYPDLINHEILQHTSDIQASKHVFRKKFEIDTFLRLRRILSETSEQRKAPMYTFLQHVLLRKIREDVYKNFQKTSTELVTDELLQHAIAKTKEQIYGTIGKENWDELDALGNVISDEISQALEGTRHLQYMFTHRLSVEQCRVIYQVAQKEGIDVLAHPPGEGKTAMAIASAWEYFRHKGKLDEGIIFYLGPISSINTIKYNFPKKQNRELERHPTVIQWKRSDRREERYDKLIASLQQDKNGILILPLNFDMLEGKSASNFTRLFEEVRRQNRPFVVIADEYHHLLGGYLQKQFLNGDGIDYAVFQPISEANKNNKIYAVETHERNKLIDTFVRYANKSILLTGTPMVTDIAQLIHLASLLESKQVGNTIVYPSYETVTQWVSDPLTLSTLFQEKMYRSNHLEIPKVQNIVLEVDTTPVKPLVKRVERYESDISYETRLLLPYIKQLIEKNSNEYPIIITTTYIKQGRPTGGASSSYILEYLRAQNIINSETLDGSTPTHKEQKVIERFRENDGIDVIILSPAFSESRDLQGTRPINLVITIGPTTIKNYEQAIRRAVRPGNMANEVYAIIPIVKDNPSLRHRYELLHSRLQISQAILDPHLYLPSFFQHIGLEDFENMRKFRETVTPTQQEINQFIERITTIDEDQLSHMSEWLQATEWNGREFFIVEDRLNKIDAYQQAIITDKRVNMTLEATEEIRETTVYMIEAITKEIASMSYKIDMVEIPDIDTVKAHILKNLGIILKINESKMLKRKVWESVKNVLEAYDFSEIYREVRERNSKPAFEDLEDKVLLYLYAYSHHNRVKENAYEILHQRYRSYINKLAYGSTSEEIKDRSQQVWEVLYKSKPHPFTNTLAPIIRIIMDRIRMLEYRRGTKDNIENSIDVYDPKNLSF